MVTPGVSAEYQDTSELGATESVRYRAAPARLNYLSQDRSDIQFAVKEACRHMTNPRVCDWNKIKRIGRYLIKHPKCVIVYKYQRDVCDINVWTDSDFAGCKGTRNQHQVDWSRLGII